MGIPFKLNYGTLLKIRTKTRGVKHRSNRRRAGANQEGKKKKMNQIRGIVMLVLGSFALYQGWKIHTGNQALWAYALGVVAIAVGIWRLTRKPPQPLA
jgi:uncharacterized membrane protein HdeD (DUF308 family)